jgi:hypothetical protein
MINIHNSDYITFYNDDLILNYTDIYITTFFGEYNILIRSHIVCNKGNFYISDNKDNPPVIFDLTGKNLNSIDDFINRRIRSYNMFKTYDDAINNILSEIDNELTKISLLYKTKLNLKETIKNHIL